MQTTASRTTQHASIRDITQRKSIRDAAWLTLVTIIVILGSIMLLFPVAFMVTTSLKTSGDAFLLPIKWLPGVQFAPHFENYTTALNFMKWQRVFGNTLIVGLNSVVGTVISCAIVAYGFARFRAPGRSQIFVLVLASLMIPYVSRLVPEYLAFAKLGMVDTLLPLMIPPWFGSAFNIFLLRQFFMTIPMEMDEAAKIDGAGPIRVFFSVLLPQIRPALAVVAIGDFTFNWNDFLRPLIYLNSPDKRTAAVALSFFQASFGGTPYNLVMAATLSMLIPVLILFFVAQRYFIQGIVVSGVKG